jgi:hypothetical protein
MYDRQASALLTPHFPVAHTCRRSRASEELKTPTRHYETQKQELGTSDVTVVARPSDTGKTGVFREQFVARN